MLYVNERLSYWYDHLGCSDTHLADNPKRYLRCTTKKVDVYEDYGISDDLTYRVCHPDERDLGPGRRLRKRRDSKTVSTFGRHSESFTQSCHKESYPPGYPGDFRRH